MDGGPAQGAEAQVIVLDANILVSAMLGKRVRKALADAALRGVAFCVPEPQLEEAARVLEEKIGLSRDEVESALQAMTQLVSPAPSEFFAARETAARARLHDRGQPDWPVLATALAADAGIWPHDRDFFGVGAPVWSTRNLQFASA